MWSLLLLLVLVVLAEAIFPKARPRFLRSRSASAGSAWPVFSRPVMSEVERQAYARLVKAFPRHLVLPQVQICRFVETSNVSGRRAVLNRYQFLSADFLVCDTSARPLCVIELDDSSHLRKDRLEADRRKGAVLAAARVPLLRYRVGFLPDLVGLQKDLAQCLGLVGQVPELAQLFAERPGL